MHTGNSLLGRIIASRSSAVLRATHHWQRRFTVGEEHEKKAKTKNKIRRRTRETATPSESLFLRVEDILNNNRISEADTQKKSGKLGLPRVEKASMTRSDALDAPAFRFDKDTPSSRKPKSLFEVFNIPRPTSLRNPSAFDPEAYRQYTAVLDPFLNGESRFVPVQHGKTTDIKPLIRWLETKEPAVSCGLKSLKVALDSDVGSGSNVDAASSFSPSASFAQELSDQRQRFMEYYELSAKQYALATRNIHILAGLCAKQAHAEPVSVLWQKFKEAGMTSQNLLHTLLYLASSCSKTQRRRDPFMASSILDILDGPGLHDVASSVATNDSLSSDDVHVELVDEIATYHDLLYEPTEQTINIKVRLLLAQKRPRQAEELVEKHLDKTTFRLRTFLPILKLYLQQKDIDSSLRIYRRMLSISPPVKMDFETFVPLIVGLAENGYFRHSSPPIPSAESLGFTAASGPALLDEIATQMAKDVTEIPLTSAKRLYNGFASGFPEYNLSPKASLAPLEIVSDLAAADEMVLNRVRISLSTGDCVRTGVRLRLVQLEDADSEQLKQSILKLARTMQVNFQETLKEFKGNEIEKTRADDSLISFWNWLDSRKGEPFTAVIDGANIGYYSQNFSNGRFSFHQIQFVCDHLQRLGENPLIILPYKYTRPSFYNTIGAGGSSGSRRQLLTQEEVLIRERLIKSGKVFVVPRGFLDDFYWIIASLSRQTKATSDLPIFVEPGNSEGRWPGRRPVLITNDQMRDHRLNMLEPRLFRRWYSNVVVTYSFAGFVNDQCLDKHIGFSPADVYTREIQGNAFNDATVWHFPIAGTEDEWFCVRIPSQNEYN